jgi:hypothetical protein
MLHAPVTMVLLCGVEHGVKRLTPSRHDVCAHDCWHVWDQVP